MAKKNVVLDPNETHEGQQSTEVKMRKPREVKVKHAQGSPHEILHTLVDSLTSTEADHVLRHTKKHYKGVDVSGLDEESLDLAAINGIKGKLA